MGPTHTYTAVGTYEVALTVTDEDDLTDTGKLIVTVAEEIIDTMHVDIIIMSLKVAGPNRNGIALLTVVDAFGTPVEGATVNGHWSGLTSDVDSGLTDANGQVSIKSDKRRNVHGTFTFNVDDVTLSEWVYDVASSVESGSITVP